jgi:hypothetical protein
MSLKILDEDDLFSVPLWWIPTLCNASPSERKKRNLRRSETMMLWEPDNPHALDSTPFPNYERGFSLLN